MIQRGSLVIIHKPERSMPPGWVDPMDRYSGRLCIVRKVYDTQGYDGQWYTVVRVFDPVTNCIPERDFVFNIEWCTEVTISDEEFDDSALDSLLAEWGCVDGI